MRSDRRIWVVGAGDAGRRRQIGRVFHGDGIVAIGPAGTIEEITENAKKGAKEPGMVSRFKDVVQEGDLVLLRAGKREVIDIGVLGPYSPDPGFGVASWDLGHVRTTSWCNLEPTERQHLQDLLEKDFWWGRFYELKGNHKLGTKINRLVSKYHLEPPHKEWQPTSTLEPYEFVSKVVETASNGGIDSKELCETIGVAEAFGRGDDEYHRLEADSIAMMLVPLFRSLGVAMSRIRVEVPVSCLTDQDTPNRRVDLVIFDDKGTSDPKLFVEVKRRWNGLDGARQQMDEYLELTARTDLPNLVTDGTEFELKNLSDEPDETWDISLQWRTLRSAKSLAKLADYLAAS